MRTSNRMLDREGRDVVCSAIATSVSSDVIAAGKNLSKFGN